MTINLFMDMVQERFNLEFLVIPNSSVTERPSLLELCCWGWGGNSGQLRLLQEPFKGFSVEQQVEEL